MGWRAVGSDPDSRFSLADERTFLAWIAIVGGGSSLRWRADEPAMRLGECPRSSTLSRSMSTALALRKPGGSSPTRATGTLACLCVVASLALLARMVLE
jgi:hypothetical protein